MQDANIMAQLRIYTSDVFCHYLFDNTNYSDAGTVFLAQVLHHNTLSKLNLSNNIISDADTVALAQIVHQNSNLNELNLAIQSISSTCSDTSS